MENEDSARLTVRRIAIPLLACIVVLGVCACGHATVGQGEEKPSPIAMETITDLKAGIFGPVTEQQVVDAQRGRLITMLEARYAGSQDTDLKSRIACALVKLGDKGEVYWDFLVEQATPAIESDAPDPRCLDLSGNCGSGPSPAYAAWTNAHKVFANSLAEQALLEYPHKVEVLASTGDPRGVPLLRRALTSPNYEIESMAAEGLAEAHDKASVPLIIEASKRAPARVAPLIAEYLKWFDDPNAQSAAEAYANKPPDALESLKKGDLSPVFIEKVAGAQDLRAIPVLAGHFARIDDQDTKAQIASALIRLGDKDKKYWDFLYGQARTAVESDAPSATSFDSEGKLVPGLPKQFVDWANSHHLSTDSAQSNALVLYPGTVLYLAATGDTRGIPLLRKALSSSNFMIQSSGARGLAKLQDNDSIPLIVEACKRAPSGAANAIAVNLVYFDDPRAQSAVDKYVPADYAKALRDGRSHGSTPLP